MAATTTVQCNSLPFDYPAEIRTETGRQQFRLKFQRENPELLFKDCYSSKGKMITTNLLFYTDHTSAWHTALCTHFKFTTKRGIGKGRQICIFEDEDKESKFLTVNIYQNGTVMVQGNQAALCSFEKAFPTVKDLSDSGKESTNQAPRTESLPPLSTVLQMTPASDTMHLPTCNTQSPDLEAEVAQLKDSISNIETGVVELTKEFGRYAQDNHADAFKDQLSQVRNQMKASIQEIRGLTENLVQNNEKLQAELTELKDTVKKDFAEMRCEMRREITKLREELYLRDEVIEQLKTVYPPPTPNSPQRPVLDPTEQPCNQQPTPASAETRPAPSHAESISCSAPGNGQNTASTTKLDRAAEVAILIDSNGKFLQEQVLFPGQRVSKIWSPRIEDALCHLSDPEFGSPAHIIIHTGTNDLRTEQERVGKLIGRLANKATESFPSSRITVSTLLPRRDFHPTTIQKVNADISRDCARLPNVHVAHHYNISTYDLYDQCHLSKRAVGKFAKTLKDTALGRQPPTDGHSSQPWLPHKNTPAQRTMQPHRPPYQHHRPTGPTHKPPRPAPQPKRAHTPCPPTTARGDNIYSPRPPTQATHRSTRPDPSPPEPACTSSSPDLQPLAPAHPPPSRANHWLPEPSPHQHHHLAKPGNHPPTHQLPTTWLHHHPQHAAQPTTLETSYAEVLKGEASPKMGEIKQMLLYICSKLT